MTGRRTYNERLPDLPGDDEVVEAVRYVVEHDPRCHYKMGASANLIAQHLKINGARRLGRGAVKGSWSGSMSGALRISPRLRSLAARGLIRSYYDRDDHRHVYLPVNRKEPK